MKKVLQKLSLIILPPLIYIFMRLVWFSTSKKFHFLNPISEEQSVCVSWHGELFMSPQVYRHVRKNRPASAIISTHTDGSLIANTLKFLSIRPLRGSSRRRAAKVLIEAFRSIKEGEEVLLTPDGPKGPRHHMSDGAVAIALKSKLPIIMMNSHAKHFWQLKSWDQFIIPKPFTTLNIYIQSVSLDGMDLNEAKALLLQKMLEHSK
ncbi:MAG: hypothetical protein DRQ78_02315 [Epsilonproteobacteria bacterium]|nr:MAG: hypothetical protein DRQ78_02315 [Campylobacterota bacterium]